VRSLLLVALLLIAAGCGPVASSAPAASTVASASPSTAASSPVSLESPASPVEGIVVRVVSSGLDDVQGFTIRTSAGEMVDFRMGELVNGAEFPPGHLAEHQATSEPVRVYFEVDGGERVAVRIDDASG